MKLRILVLCLGMLLFAGSLPAQASTAAEEGTAAIEKGVTHELNMLPYWSAFDYVNFTVGPSGTVTLTGEVTEPFLKSDAGRAAQNAAGVTHVDNRIKVLPVSPMDARLRWRLYRSIYGEPMLQHYGVGINASIRIIVDNGHVTLKGYVNNKADRIIAGMQAGSVPGIFSVDNQLQVAKG